MVLEPYSYRYPEGHFIIYERWTLVSTIVEINSGNLYNVDQFHAAYIVVQGLKLHCNQGEGVKCCAMYYFCLYERIAIRLHSVVRQISDHQKSTNNISMIVVNLWQYIIKLIFSVCCLCIRCQKIIDVKVAFKIELSTKALWTSKLKNILFL
jgi:hypothetical protein